jgi:hypothetical protein
MNRADIEELLRLLRSIDARLARFEETLEREFGPVSLVAYNINRSPTDDNLYPRVADHQNERRVPRYPPPKPMEGDNDMVKCVCGWSGGKETWKEAMGKPPWLCPSGLNGPHVLVGGQE